MNAEQINAKRIEMAEKFAALKQRMAAREEALKPALACAEEHIVGYAFTLLPDDGGRVRMNALDDPIVESKEYQLGDLSWIEAVFEVEKDNFSFRVCFQYLWNIMDGDEKGRVTIRTKYQNNWVEIKAYDLEDHRIVVE